jgi:hypothetical protein
VRQSRRDHLADEEATQVNPSCGKILRYYNEGRITATGFIIDFLNSVDQDDLREALEILPPELLERLRDFVASWRPDMRVFRGPPPDPNAVRMARELLANTEKST